MFYIDQADDALEYALIADKLFADEPKTSIFSRTITTKVIEKYVNVKSGKEPAVVLFSVLQSHFLSLLYSFFICLLIYLFIYLFIYLSLL